MSQRTTTYVPEAVTEAVNKIVARFPRTKVYYALDGEVIVTYRIEGQAGLGAITVVDSGKDDGWVLCLHTPPRSLEPGLPERFNANVMYDTEKDWWPQAEPTLRLVKND